MQSAIYRAKWLGNAQDTQDQLYGLTQQAKEQGCLAKWLDLKEIAQEGEIISWAIDRVLGNKGARTPGVDKEEAESLKKMDRLQLINEIRVLMDDYKPKPAKRVYIPKPGKSELRPLGIPTLRDRIVQMCLKIVLEPILEAHFSKRSYGFRPDRNGHMAVQRVVDIAGCSDCHYVVEVDIKSYFDTVNHRVMLNKLYGLGICDRRVLQMIKAMLEAGVMEYEQYLRTKLGTPQGGIISPLLANAYLHSLDKWIVGNWEEKRTRKRYASEGEATRALKGTKLVPMFLVRYADDFVILTNSLQNAEKIRHKVGAFLRDQLKVEMHEEKTCITHLQKGFIRFLGFEIMVRRNPKAKLRYGRWAWLPKTQPDLKRLKAKLIELRKEIWLLRKLKSDWDVIAKIHILNAKIVGMHNYYRWATDCYEQMRRKADSIQHSMVRSLTRRKSRWKWVRACDCSNLRSKLSKYTKQIPALWDPMLKGWVGLVHLGMVTQKKFLKPFNEETRFTERGRELIRFRKHKEALFDGITTKSNLMETAMSDANLERRTNKSRYNSEYVGMRDYIYRRDKGKCRICKRTLLPGEARIHHLDPTLPVELLNKAKNLILVCEPCHENEHDPKQVANTGRASA